MIFGDTTHQRSGSAKIVVMRPFVAMLLLTNPMLPEGLRMTHVPAVRASRHGAARVGRPGPMAVATSAALPAKVLYDGQCMVSATLRQRSRHATLL